MMSEEKKVLADLESNIPYDYCRSCDSEDGLYHEYIDEDSWQYKVKMLLKEKDIEIERLNKLISQREKKWEKWTTEKQILSTKMSDYLCKYQNLKREYTKQIKISTDRKKEIERLNNIINKANKILSNILVVSDWEHKGKYRPIKNTTSQEVYKSVCMLYGILKTPHRSDYGSLQELKGEDKE